MLILALDCSTTRGSAALAVGADLKNCQWYWREEFSAGRGQGGLLFTALERGLAQARPSGEKLGEIVVGLGPGSYSGVRQAIAAATGLTLATGARLRGRPSVAALTPDHGNYQVVGDARRGAYYWTLVQSGDCLEGPELVPDLPTLRARMDLPGEYWYTCAVENVPPGLPPEMPVFFPRADRLLMGSPDTLTCPPLEPIYLRPVSITLPKPRP